MRTPGSRTRYSYTSEASVTGISVMTESLRPKLLYEENFTDDRQNKHLEDRHYKLTDDASSNLQSRRANGEALEKLFVTNSDQFIIPSNHRRGGGTKANKQQLSSEEEECLNQNLRVGGSGLRSNNCGSDKSRHLIKREHKKSSTMISKINSERVTWICDYRQIGALKSRQMIQARGEEVSEPSANDSESRLKLPKLRIIPKKKGKDKGYC